MSGEALFQVLDRDTSPTAPSVRLTLVGLAWMIPRGSHSVTSDPTAIVARLLRSTGLGRTSVYRGLRTLAAADLIEVEDLRGGRRIRLNVGDWRTSRSGTDPRLSPDLGPDLGFAPIYEEKRREDRELVREVDSLQRTADLRASGLRYSEIAAVLSEEGLR